MTFFAFAVHHAIKVPEDAEFFRPADRRYWGIDAVYEKSVLVSKGGLRKSDLSCPLIRAGAKVARISYRPR